jgi:hypothetical protein
MGVAGDSISWKPAMTEDDDVAARNKRETRLMWGFSAAIVLIPLVGMGANMLWHHPSGTESPTDISSRSSAAPPN